LQIPHEANVVTQNLRKSDQFDQVSDLFVLQGQKAILEREGPLQQLAERCDQRGAMHWLGYFMGGAGVKWKHPYLVLHLKPGVDVNSMNPSDLLGAALFFELRVFGVGTGAFSTDDWEGLRTVIAPAAMRGELAARAVHALIQRGAHVVLTTYRHTSPEEKAASRMLQRRGVLWTEYDRKVTKHRLMLEKTYDETLAKFGKQTRFNFRYYRKRLMARMDCRFLADALPEVDETELVLMNAKALNPVSEDECRRRFRAARDLADGFLIALRGPQGQLLSILGGWRQGTTTVMHHQSQIAGFEKDSLCTVMRAFFLESEIERGTRTVIFYHGTNHRMTHAFDVEPLRDLVVCRKSLRARLLRKLATRVASPRYYRDTHYFGGSTTFFASTLTHEDAIWRSGPQEWRDPVDVAPEAESEFVKRS
jgi:hypothetical protein